MNILLYRCSECKKYYLVEERGKNWDRVEQIALIVSKCEPCREEEEHIPPNVREPPGCQ